MFNVTPQGNPVTITTTAGVFRWPDVFRGTASGTDNLPGFITPYMGNIASGTLTGYSWRTHPINTPLTFSGVALSVPTGVAITSMTWNFGDGVTSSAIVPTHIYRFLVPSMIATLGVQFSTAQEVFVPKQMNLTAS